MDKPDGWYLPANKEDVAIILETKSESEDISNPKWIDERELAVNALQVMSNMKITCMPVLNEQYEVVGSILMQDIFKAGIVR